MNKSLKTTLAAILAAAAWALAPQALADDLKSMRGIEVTAPDSAPEAKAYAGKRPGTQPVIARTFNEQPPLIPHAVDNFDEVTLEENQCLSCHGPEVFKKKNAPKIGDSHFKDREGKMHEMVSALRHNCVQCHVPQVDAPPLVDNAFKGTPVAAKPAAK